jgi:hypothetical protein
MTEEAQPLRSDDATRGTDGQSREQRLHIWQLVQKVEPLLDKALSAGISAEEMVRAVEIMREGRDDG